MGAWATVPCPSARGVGLSSLLAGRVEGRDDIRVQLLCTGWLGVPCSGAVSRLQGCLGNWRRQGMMDGLALVGERVTTYCTLGGAGCGNTIYQCPLNQVQGMDYY
jgi:hypothetical protein